MTTAMNFVLGILVNMHNWIVNILEPMLLGLKARSLWIGGFLHFMFTIGAHISTWFLDKLARMVEWIEDPKPEHILAFCIVLSLLIAAYVVIRTVKGTLTTLVCVVCVPLELLVLLFGVYAAKRRKEQK